MNLVRFWKGWTLLAWDAEITWYSLSARFAWSIASQSTVLSLPDLAWLSKFLQLQWNFLNHLVTILRSTAPSLFAQQIILVASTALWLSLNLQKQKFLNYTTLNVHLCGLQIMQRVKQYTMYLHTTMILSTTVGTSHSLNCFGRVIYMPQSITYQNIAKFLIHHIYAVIVRDCLFILFQNENYIYLYVKNKYQQYLYISVFRIENIFI